MNNNILIHSYCSLRTNIYIFRLKLFPSKSAKNVMVKKKLIGPILV